MTPIPLTRRGAVIAVGLVTLTSVVMCFGQGGTPASLRRGVATDSGVAAEIAPPAPPMTEGAVASQPAAAYAEDQLRLRRDLADGSHGLAGAVGRSAVPVAAPVAPAKSAEQISQLSQVAPGDATVLPSMVIRTGQASVQVDSLETAIAVVRRLAQQLGGYVAGTTFQSGDQNVRAATLEVKLPAARFDEAVSGLSPLGKVESVNVSAQDVGEEFVDITARVTNARRLELRLIDLLANRTGKLQEVLQVERELARVREEIERYEGRLRYLRTRSAVSTLTINVHEPFPVLRAPGHNPIADAFRDAWRNFVGFVAAVIAAMGIVLPLGALAGLVVWGGRRLLPRSAPPAAPPTLPPPAQA
jgi:hypothetical protein